MVDYQFVRAGTVAHGNDSVETSVIHAASAEHLTLCGRPVVTVMREEVNDVAWIVAGCKTCDREMETRRH
jgi:phenylpyruvate tautomerase PptA (4-oxalocrotonate tautomerase family)